MRTIAEKQFGGPIALMDLPTPEIAAGEVRIRVRAAGVNPFDWKVADGELKDELEHRFPLILGFDAAGVVERVGADVTELAEGDEVYGYLFKLSDRRRRLRGVRHGPGCHRSQEARVAPLHGGGGPPCAGTDRDGPRGCGGPQGR